MRVFVLLSVAALFLGLVNVPVASAQTGAVWAGQPGPYEIHHYHHRVDGFNRAPYYSTNPPVYYSYQRYGRSYGWTPYPYQGIQFNQGFSPLVPSARPKTRNQSVLNPPVDKYDALRAGRYTLEQ